MIFWLCWYILLCYMVPAGATYPRRVRIFGYIRQRWDCKTLFCLTSCRRSSSLSKVSIRNSTLSVLQVTTVAGNTGGKDIVAEGVFHSADCSMQLRFLRGHSVLRARVRGAEAGETLTSIKSEAGLASSSESSAVHRPARRAAACCSIPNCASDI